MSLLFPPFKNSTLHSVVYEYKPLDFFIHAILTFKNENYGDSHSEHLIKKARGLLNIYLSGKPMQDNIDVSLKDLCKERRTETTKIINNIIKHIDIRHIILECLENLVLNSSFDKFGLLIESESQWDFIFELIQERELDSFIIPILKKEMRDKYFDFPIITFLPASWIQELIILPPSENFFLITPSSRKMISTEDIFFKAPNNSSIEISVNKIKVINYKPIALDVTDEFHQEFVKSNVADIEIKNTMDFDAAELGENEKYKYPLRVFNLVDIKGRYIQIEANKNYICISANGDVGLNSFENECQLNNTAYIVNEVDNSNVTEDDFKRAQNNIMEEWKKPLRTSLWNPSLPYFLKKFGATRANEQNIRHWSDSDRIAPANDDDFRAVLKFAGIENESKIKQFFRLARKQRGQSISFGHSKSVLTHEIIKIFLASKLTEVTSDLADEYKHHGIKINISKLDNKLCQK
jgi:hypothetical protein